MKLDLSEKIKDLKGKELLKGESVGVTFAQHLMEISTVEPLRVFKISMALLDDKEIEIDEKDYTILKRIVEEGTLSNIFKARILTQLEKGKDAK